MFSPGAFRITNFPLCFFYWRIFAKCRPGKYDFDSSKEALWWKKWPKFAKFGRFKFCFFSNQQIFYDNLQQCIVKNRQGFFCSFFFPTFMSSMYPKLAKHLFPGWSPLWLHHKILKSSFSFTAEFFAKSIHTWKMQFWPIGRIFHGKMAQIRQISKIK